MKKDKPKNEEPHDTMDEYCCACEYDIAVTFKGVKSAIGNSFTDSTM